MEIVFLLLVKCVEDISAYPTGVLLPQEILTLLALLDDHLCVGFKTQFAINDSAQVFVLVTVTDDKLRFTISYLVLTESHLQT